MEKENLSRIPTKFTESRCHHLRALMPVNCVHGLVLTCYVLLDSVCGINKLCVRPPQYAPAPPVTFDLLTLKAVSESRVTWATCLPILVFLGLSVLDLGPMYATDRQMSDAHHRLMPLSYMGGGIIIRRL